MAGKSRNREKPEGTKSVLQVIRSQADKGKGLEKQPGEYGVKGDVSRGKDKNGIWKF